MSSKDDAQREMEETKQKAQAKLDATKEELEQRLRNDGVVNPKQLYAAGFGLIFLAAVPVTSFISQPNGLLEKTINGVVRTIAYVGSAGSQSTISQNGKIAALSALYIASTYAFSGAASAAGVGAANKEGRDNNHPRAQEKELTGLPLRLHSAHYNLMEMFPGFALTAALTQAMAPGNQQLINLLGLHVLSKVFLYYPSYIFNVGVPRSIAHVLATASVINVAWKLARGSSLLSRAL